MPWTRPKEVRNTYRE